MRIWGRNAAGQWLVVTTDANGLNDAVYLTNLIQCLKLNLGESPFWANYGIPAQPSLITQIFPDFDTYKTQGQFRQYFLSLTVQKSNSPTPIYNINAITHSGAIISEQVPV